MLHQIFNGITNRIFRFFNGLIPWLEVLSFNKNLIFLKSFKSVSYLHLNSVPVSVIIVFMVVVVVAVILSVVVVLFEVTEGSVVVRFAVRFL